MALKAVHPVSTKRLIDFENGPFADKKKFPVQTRRIILTKLLGELLKHPEVNAAIAIKVHTMLKYL